MLVFSIQFGNGPKTKLFQRYTLNDILIELDLMVEDYREHLNDPVMEASAKIWEVIAASIRGEARSGSLPAAEFYPPGTDPPVGRMVKWEISDESPRRRWRWQAH